MYGILFSLCSIYMHRPVKSLKTWLNDDNPNFLSSIKEYPRRDMGPFRVNAAPMQSNPVSHWFEINTDLTVIIVLASIQLTGVSRKT